MTKHITIFGGVAVLLLIFLGVLYYTGNGASEDSDNLGEFAQCLGQKGATFYGAFWCPHCAEQKALFGSSKKFLPYVECSTADGKGQLQACKDKGVSGYPTWEFAGGERLSGVVSLQTLAEKTGCALPSAESQPAAPAT